MARASVLVHTSGAAIGCPSGCSKAELAEREVRSRPYQSRDHEPKGGHSVDVTLLRLKGPLVKRMPIAKAM